MSPFPASFASDQRGYHLDRCSSVTYIYIFLPTVIIDKNKFRLTAIEGHFSRACALSSHRQPISTATSVKWLSKPATCSCLSSTCLQRLRYCSKTRRWAKVDAACPLVLSKVLSMQPSWKQEVSVVLELHSADTDCAALVFYELILFCENKVEIYFLQSSTKQYCRSSIKFGVDSVQCCKH